MTRRFDIISSRSGALKRAEWVLHVLIWAYVFASPLFFRRRGEEINWLAYGPRLYFPLASCVVFYVNFLVLVPRFFVRRRYGTFVLLNLLLLVAAVASFAPYAGLFPPPEHFHPRRMPRGPRPQWLFWVMAGRNFVSLAFVAFVAVAVRLSMLWRSAEDARREAELGRSEAELKNLKNQLNPHFLLNTLNNIYALTALDPEAAGRAVLELGRLLRYVLYEDQKGLVPLRREAEFLRTYVELMRIRLPKHVETTVDFDIPEDKDEPMVAPLIFISLVENAFKHGVSPTQPSFVRITLRADSRQVYFLCRNSNFPKSDGDHSPRGIGLRQVSGRLELAYPGRHTWHYGLADDGQSYYSEITIKI